MEDAVDRSKVNDASSEIMKLSDQEQIAVAKKVVRSFDPHIKEQFISEFETKVETLEARRRPLLRIVSLIVGAMLLAFCLGGYFGPYVKHRTKLTR